MIEHHDQYAAAEAEGPQIEDNDDRPLYASQPRPATIRTTLTGQGSRAYPDHLKPADSGARWHREWRGRSPACRSVPDA